VLGPFFVNQPDDELVADINAFPILCNGNLTSISLDATGGTGAYTYFWSNSATTQTLNSVPAGLYAVTVTDANNCTAFDSEDVQQPALLEFTSMASNISCNGAGDGTISLNVSGGTVPYSFNWNPASTLEDLTGLEAGSYAVTITDANGCSTDGSYTITEPDPIVVTYTTSNFNGYNISQFNGSNGTINVTAGGGIAPLSIAWSDNGTITTFNRTGLTAGAYTFTVTDSSPTGPCHYIQTVTLTQPAQLVVSYVSQVNIFCPGDSNGSIQISVTGGVPGYTYVWKNQLNAIVSNIEDPILLPAGTYSVTVTDVNNATASLTGIVLSQPVSMTAELLDIDVTCNGFNNGSIEVVSLIGGQSPYMFQWFNNANPNLILLTTYGMTSSISGLSPNEYCVKITDANGCFITKCAIITQPEPLSLVEDYITEFTTNGYFVSCFGEDDGAIHITVSGGTTPYVYAWGNNYATSEDVDNVSIGTTSTMVAFGVSVDDANGCEILEVWYLTQPEPIMVEAVVDQNVSC
jgi:hypothetical protein